MLISVSPRGEGEGRNEEPKMFEETTTHHLVKPEDLNHHGTLFAGQLARWLLEAGLIAASRLVGRPEDVVCVHLNGMDFKKPVKNGALVEIKSRIVFLGTTRITIHSQVFVMRAVAPLITSMATFVTVDKENKPYAHGFMLPDECIARNRQIYDEALRYMKTRN